MTQRQRRRKEVALAGKAEIISRLNQKITEFKGYLKDDTGHARLSTEEHLEFLEGKKKKHEQEAETLKNRLAGR